MVCHDDECFEFVALQMLRAVVDGIHHQLRDGLLFQVERSTTGGVEISVHPDKGLSRIPFTWRRVDRVWQAPVEMARNKQARTFGPYVGKSTAQLIHDSLVVADGKNLPEKGSSGESVGNWWAQGRV